MKLEQVAAQLYTIRAYTRTAEDFARSMAKLQEIGYRSVQVSAIGPIPRADVVRILDAEGLTCCAIHVAGAEIVGNPDAVIEQMHTLRCKHVAYPHPGEIPMNTPQEVKKFAAQLEEAGQRFHEAGMVLSYHNHSIELKRAGTRTILDWIYRSTNPAYLQAEIDTYWVQHGGGDPVEWCRKLKGRLPLLHMKDYKIGEDNKPDYAEIGNGNLNWRRIISTAERSGCEWFIVEQDTTPGDPFDSLKISFNYIKMKLCEKPA
ncbi:MAG: sugar phosphate isomerase/epimerase family protein [Candidatus Sumerlaeaceae bacterium]